MTKRNTRGNMLIFSIVLTVAAISTLCFFAFNYTRILASYPEQVTAVEAAALTAAVDIEKIVVEDPNLGLIAISGLPPKGKDTLAGDMYGMPVHSINTLLATSRLDCIIADKLNDPIMKHCADRDYKNTLKAKDLLVAALQTAITAGGAGKDWQGNQIFPLKDATDAYNKNIVRMSGGRSSLLPGSLKLSLGLIEGLVTSTKIPQPSEFAEMQQDQEENGFYKANINVPYKEKNFVFAAISDSVKLVDHKGYADKIDSLPYSIPTIVKCEADHQFFETEEGGRPKERIVHGIACAEPASLNDNRPAPGRLFISFPNGSVPEIKDLYTLLTNANIAKSPTDLSYSPSAGDYPPTSLSKSAVPIIGKLHAPFGQLLRVATYDWIRRGGSNLNVQSLFEAFGKEFAQDSNGHADVFNITADGNVSKEVIPIAATPALPVSHKQWFAVSGLAFQSINTKKYDILAKDYCYQPGRINGGIHGGEPLGSGGPAQSGTAYEGRGIDEDPSLISQFPVGNGSDIVRPTYQTAGIAAEIRFRAR